MGQPFYLYGFVPSGGPAPAIEGVEGGTVELLPCDRFDAVVSRLPAEWSSPRELDERLQDVAWAGAQGLAHESVVAWFVDHAEILPAPLLSVFTAEETLREEADQRADDILAALERFRGLREWDLKVSFDAESLAANLGQVSPEVAELERRIGEASPGRRFLLERKRADLVREQVSARARELAARLLAAVKAGARDARVLPLPRGAVPAPVVLNAALLVERDGERRFRDDVGERADDLERLGIHAHLSGPWAPYRFLAEEGP